MDRHLEATSPGNVITVSLACGLRHNMAQFQILQSQAADMTTEHVGAIQLPEQLGRCVKMADVKIAIDDHDAVVRPLEHSQQEVGGVDHRAIVSAHRSNPDAALEAIEGWLGWGNHVGRKTYRSNGVKKVVRSRDARWNGFILKNSLPSSEVGHAEWRRRRGEAWFRGRRAADARCT